MGEQNSDGVDYEEEARKFYETEKKIPNEGGGEVDPLLRLDQLKRTAQMEVSWKAKTDSHDEEAVQNHFEKLLEALRKLFLKD